MNPHLLLIFNFILLLQVNSKHSKNTKKSEKKPLFPLNLDPSILREAFSEPTALLNFYGYPAENHTIATNDGYILTVHRIPSNNKSAVPFLLMHGMTCASTQFFMIGKKSPAFLLANAGYDIWMGNFRGTPYSSHTKYKYKHYWDFSWQEMAEHDLPDTIDYILNYTNQSKLFLAAQSLGTTVSFALLSSQPSYNDKILCYFALTPVVTITYNPIYFLNEAHRFTEKHPSIKNIIGSRQIGNVYDIFLNTSIEFCSSKTFSYICEYLFGLIQGYNPYLHNITRIPVYISRCHHGTSAKTIVHYSQSIPFKKMHKFDYGEIKNKDLYNSSIPPVYSMRQISVPVVIFQAPNDHLANALDVEILSKQLRNLKGKELCPWPMCNHADIMTSTNASEYLCDKLISHAKSILTKLT